MRHSLASILLVSLLLGSATTAGAADVSDLFQRSYEQEVVRDFGGALGTLERIPAAQQGSYLFVLRRAWLLYLTERYPDSVQQYERAVGLAPKAIEPRLGLSLAQMAARRWLDADKTLNEVLRLDPANYLGLSRLAWTRFNLGRFSEAEASYRRVLALYPSDVQMQVGLGWSVLKQGRAPEARTLFQAVLEVAPNDGSARSGVEASGPGAVDPGGAIKKQ